MKRIIAITVLLFACTVQATYSQDYKLVWSDEFNGDSLDTDTWNFWEGPAYNNELQYYTPRDKNAYLKDGKLYLEAHREHYRGMEYTSARISTDSTRIGWEHGRFEARLKMPEGKGFWPAFWLMPIRDIGWPKGGEIDIMEYRGNEPFTTSGAIHFWRGDCEGETLECRKFLVDEYTTDGDKLSESFHTYALEWTDEELLWYFDDEVYQRIRYKDIETEFNPFSTPFYIILNLAVGGDFLPNPDESTKFPQAFVVDYVRVYQK
ncbi:MAG: glycoside hydrolase family 16 protein [Balneolaceae bacterium]|nr:glycoside hydrolase family 16 protein [Balneolaceae bacterium]